ncbi:MAG: outer membrane beta-barrel protein [Acidobacteriota bacterium]
MRPSPTTVPLTLLILVLFGAECRASGQPGDYALTAGVGYADARQNENYRSDQAFSFTLEYAKARHASYRASAGFMTIDARAPIPPGEGDPDADSFFLLGNIVLTPRFAVVQPFVTAGLGLYQVELRDGSGSSNDLELGANWGVGLDLQLLRGFAIRSELTYHYITGDLTSPVQTLTFGGRFDL